MKQPFLIDIEQSVITDLQNRLAATRWPNEIDNKKWDKGTNETYLKKLCAYWQNGFNWKQQESYLNSFSHYKTMIDETEIHFIYQKGKGTTSIPLLLTHGYPDSFFRFHKLIPLLTAAGKNGFSFDVVVPSLPGYGFSGKPTEKGMDPKRIAGLFADLMTEELGFKKFMAQGGDWGSSITQN